MLRRTITALLTVLYFACYSSCPFTNPRRNCITVKKRQTTPRIKRTTVTVTVILVVDIAMEERMEEQRAEREAEAEEEEEEVVEERKSSSRHVIVQPVR